MNPETAGCGSEVVSLGWRLTRCHMFNLLRSQQKKMDIYIYIHPQQDPAKYYKTRAQPK